MFQDIVLVVAVLYAMKIVLFGIAAFKSRYPANSNYRPAVSIIIAARNEEHNVRRCLESIVRLTYPTNLLEVVVVNDRSTDATQTIVEEFASHHSHVKLAVAGPESRRLRGKTNAVTHGIDSSKGEILLFTDADCIVPKGWVEEMVKYYTNERVGIVAGFTSLRGKSWFESMQALDWFVLFSVAAATIRLRFPVTAVGNNLSVRRRAYDDVGGYRQIPFSVTEDYALFRAIMLTGLYEARFPLDDACLVTSRACQTWKELYRQKKRWFTGGADMDAKRLLVFGLAYLFNVLLVTALAVSGLGAVIIPISLKLSSDFFLTIPTLTTFNRRSLWTYFLHYQIYYIVYVILFPIIILTGSKVIWKERTFEDNRNTKAF